jgi:hypothetical protein
MYFILFHVQIFKILYESWNAVLSWLFACSNHLLPLSVMKKLAFVLYLTLSRTITEVLSNRLHHIMTRNIKKKHNRITHGLNAHTLTCTSTYPSIDMNVCVLFILLSLHINSKCPWLCYVYTYGLLNYLSHIILKKIQRFGNLIWESCCLLALNWMW